MAVWSARRRISRATTRNPPPVFPGLLRLDGRVNGQQVRLVGDFGDRGHDGVDAFRLFPDNTELDGDRGRRVHELLHGGLDAIQPLAAGGSQSGRLVGAGTDLFHRAGQGFAGGRDFPHRGGNLGRGAGKPLHVALLLLGSRRNLRGGREQLHAALAHALDHRLDLGDHRIDAGGQLRELVAAVDLHPGREVAGAPAISRTRPSRFSVEWVMLRVVNQPSSPMEITATALKMTIHDIQNFGRLR